MSTKPCNYAYPLLETRNSQLLIKILDPHFHHYHHFDHNEGKSLSYHCHKIDFVTIRTLVTQHGGIGDNL